ncbi:MAG: hypothetical protein PHQ59_00775 [Candidatus Daviesbacteria bacterium]|nr:hypothetical protein [Candidatus Daviesbacteria bacterium]
MATETQQAFNLQDEIYARRNCSNIASWRTRVDENLKYFTREYIVEENITRYSYGLKRGENGLPNQIYSIGYEQDGDILESFKKGQGIRARAECIGFKEKIEQPLFAGVIDKGDFAVWHSEPGKKEDGFKDHNFTFVFQVLEDRVDAIAYRNHLTTSEATNFLNQFLSIENQLSESSSDVDLLKTPVWLKGGERFNSHMDVIKALDPNHSNRQQDSCHWLLDKLQPLRRDVLNALENQDIKEAERNKIAHDNYALALLRGEITESNELTVGDEAYEERKRRLIAMGAPRLRGSCGFSGNKIGGEMSTWSGAQEAFFKCPRCEGDIPSGKGIEVCPHCGLKKEDAAEKCD